MIQRCAERDKEISSSAPVCPHCGLVYGSKSVFTTTMKVLATLFLVFVVLPLITCGVMVRLGR